MSEQKKEQARNDSGPMIDMCLSDLLGVPIPHAPRGWVVVCTPNGSRAFRDGASDEDRNWIAEAVRKRYLDAVKKLDPKTAEETNEGAAPPLPSRRRETPQSDRPSEKAPPYRISIEPVEDLETPMHPVRNYPEGHGPEYPPGNYSPRHRRPPRPRPSYPDSHPEVRYPESRQPEGRHPDPRRPRPRGSPHGAPPPHGGPHGGSPPHNGDPRGMPYEGEGGPRHPRMGGSRQGRPRPHPREGMKGGEYHRQGMKGEGEMSSSSDSVSPFGEDEHGRGQGQGQMKRRPRRPY